MRIEVKVSFSRFVWRGINTSMTIFPEVRGSIPHWRCANTTGSHTLP